MMAYAIVYSPEAVSHLAVLSTSEQRTVLDQVEVHLVHEPTVVTRRRKTLRPNPIAPWALRIGDLRVYYNVAEEPTPTVTILAVGKKVHNELWSVVRGSSYEKHRVVRS
jgi:mRNA-degrading endonuclease RelE of RelBE toxin-antitoxin system